ncbi:MAG: glycosyltransferase family 2 protein [Bacteroidia bacterium]
MSQVSILIPNYNHSKYLNQRIDSILNQTFQDFELIILDDQSTDDSKRVIESYRNHPKVTLIVYNEANSGSTFKQWDKGISLAKSDWVWIAESDDWCEPTLLAELYENATKSSDCVLSYCQSIMFENNSILWTSGAKQLAETLEGRAFVQQHMLKGNAVFNASMCIFRRDTYLKVGKEFTEYKLSGDWIFWVEVALQGTVFISGKTLNYFRKHPQDVSSAAFVRGLIYVEYFKVLDHFEKLGIVKDQKKQLLQFKQKQFLTDKRVSSEYHKSISSLFRKELGITSEKAFLIKSKIKQFLKSIS